MSLPLPLVTRLLSLFVEGESVTVFGGRLPDALAGLPLPVGTEVAASYVRSEHEDDFLAGVALDTPLGPEAFITHLAEGLEEEGWKQFREQFRPTRMLFELPGDTFDVSEPAFHSPPHFTKGDLTLRLGYPTEKAGQPTRVSLRVEKLLPPPPEEVPSGRLLELLPILTAPEGSVFGPGFVGGGNDHVTGNMSITTELAAGRLAEHFTAQLTVAGWHVAERLLGERAALVVLERQDRRRTYDAQLVVFGSAEDYSTVKFEASLRLKK